MQTATEQPFIVPDYARAVAASFGFPAGCQSCFVDEFFWIGVMATAGLPVADEIEELRARFDAMDEMQQQDRDEANAEWYEEHCPQPHSVGLEGCDRFY